MYIGPVCRPSSGCTNNLLTTQNVWEFSTGDDTSSYIIKRDSSKSFQTLY